MGSIEYDDVQCCEKKVFSTMDRLPTDTYSVIGVSWPVKQQATSIA